MNWPPFNEAGDLPPGLHRATLAEVVAHFGHGSPERRRVARRIERLHTLASSTGALARFVIFGSFITEKIAPNDADVFLVMDDSFDPTRLTGEVQMVFDHAAADASLGASVFWLRRVGCLGGEEDAVLYWQTKRDHTQRGIVELIDHDSEQ